MVGLLADGEGRVRASHPDFKALKGTKGRALGTKLLAPPRWRRPGLAPGAANLFRKRPSQALELGP